MSKLLPYVDSYSEAIVACEERVEEYDHSMFFLSLVAKGESGDISDSKSFTSSQHGHLPTHQTMPVPHGFPMEFTIAVWYTIFLGSLLIWLIGRVRDFCNVLLRRGLVGALFYPRDLEVVERETKSDSPEGSLLGNASTLDD